MEKKKVTYQSRVAETVTGRRRPMAAPGSTPLAAGEGDDGLEENSNEPV